MKENINEKYPNYKWNFDSIEQFLNDYLVPERKVMKLILICQKMVFDEQWGYSITKKNKIRIMNINDNYIFNNSNLIKL